MFGRVIWSTNWKKQSKPASLKQRKLIHVQSKLMKNQPIQLEDISNLSYNPKIELRDRIIRAIMQGNKTIEKQIEYKKSSSAVMGSTHTSRMFQMTTRHKKLVAPFKRIRAFSGQILEQSRVSSSPDEFNLKLDDRQYKSSDRFDTKQRKLNKTLYRIQNKKPVRILKFGSQQRARNNSYSHKQSTGSPMDRIEPWSQVVVDKQFQYF